MTTEQTPEKRRCPTTIALTAIVDLTQFVEICWAGLSYAQSATTIKKILAYHQDKHAGETSTIYNSTERQITREQDFKRAESLQSFAEQELTAGFPHLYQLASVRLWTIVETFVGGELLNVIMDHPEIRNLPIIRKMKGPLIDFNESSEAQQAETLLSLLSDELGARFRRGVGRFETIFEAIGLGGPIDDEVRRLIFELSEVRNVVVHRGGIVDPRFAHNCPWLNTTDGQALGVTHGQLLRYSFATQWYVVEINRREDVISPKTDSSSLSLAEVVELQEEILSNLSRIREAK
jgi:hypothetical protein